MRENSTLFMVFLLRWRRWMRRFDRGMSKRAALSARPKPTVAAECLRTETVERDKSQWRAVKIQALQLSIEGGAAHAERSGGRRHIAIGPRQRPLQHAAFGAGKTFDRSCPRAPRRSAAGNDFRRHASVIPSAWRAARVAPTTRSSASTAIRARRRPCRRPGPPGCAPRGTPDGNIQPRSARPRRSTAMAMRLTKPSVRSARQDETSSAAIRLSLMIVDRRGRAAEQRVARQKMLVAMDRERALLDQAGADAVGALALLAPVWCPAIVPTSRMSASSPGAPRRSTGMPFRSASSTQQPTPPTARYSRSRLDWATRMSGSISCRTFRSSESVIRSGDRFSVGSSRWRVDDLRQDAISADFAAPLDAIAAWIWST